MLNTWGPIFGPEKVFEEATSNLDQNYTFEQKLDPHMLISPNSREHCFESNAFYWECASLLHGKKYQKSIKGVRLFISDIIRNLHDQI